MQLIPIFFAFSLMPKIRAWSVKLGGDFYLLTFVGAFVLVTLVVFAWALSFRNPTGHHHRHHHHHKSAGPAPAAAREGGFFSRRHHKHRRKKHRPVNPTLAETGGLPAARDPQSPPKSPL